MDTIGLILSWIVFGLVVGVIGRLLVPGRQPMGWVKTILLGVVGSFAGGLIAYFVDGGQPFQPSGMLMSILGAVVVLTLFLKFGAKRI
ncbi:GlsB/YeaQ/YmgE family stress response membrane protein [Planctomicrobium sp. SH664]|uniref:GlsB/YeaQ/YmgE family stress response membrane protein n=1 Tax=Planctomicrobium sp. SH664 TaxID=3448125 RepID=UPI003F5BE05A